MTKYRYRRMCIVPENKVVEVNQALESAGYGPNNFTIPIMKGKNNITHYACDIQMDDALLDLMSDILKEANKIRKQEPVLEDILIDAGGLKSSNRFERAEKLKGFKRR